MQHLADRYELLEPLGEGGMATVWRARDLTLQREVAVKVLHHRFVGDPELRARFVREARALARLQHPNVVRIFDWEEEGETPFLVEELIAGPTLAERLRSGPLPVDEARDYSVQLLDALAAAHNQGIVHRDIKPTNILLSGSQVKMTDFGIAKLAEEAGHTTTGTWMGTAVYMAPEQFRGEAVGPEADIYSAAVLLYQMFSGAPPFEGDSLALAHRHMTEPPRPLRQVRPDLPLALAEAVDRGLAKRPADRHRTAQAFRKAVISTASIEPETVIGGHPPLRPAWSTRRRLAGVAAVFGLALALSAGAFGLLGSPRLGPSGPEPAATAPSPSTTAPPQLVAIPGIHLYRERFAVAALRDAGLVPRVHRERSRNVGIGSTIRTDPAFGMLVPEGSTVTLVLSAGPPATPEAATRAVDLDRRDEDDAERHKGKGKERGKNRRDKEMEKLQERLEELKEELFDDD